MKRVNFENGTITQNILSAALPMLIAQIINLLYNIVDRIYIARIPDVGTAALGGVGQLSATCSEAAVRLSFRSNAAWEMTQQLTPS